MLERVKTLLRGEHNSIRYKYYHLPREWLEYIILYRLRGKTWVDFYAARLDRAARQTRDNPVHESYRQDGRMHLDFLRAHGLKPTHSLFDYGCGICRSGVYFAGYLEHGNYTGADISQERLNQGRKLMRDGGIADDAYDLTCVADCHLSALEGRQFDYVFANSVLTHMPERDIRTMLGAMGGLLKPAGCFYFSYAESDERKRQNIKDFWYTRTEMRQLCEAAGYEFAILDDWPKEGDVMARVSLRKNRKQ